MTADIPTPVRSWKEYPKHFGGERVDKWSPESVFIDTSKLKDLSVISQCAMVPQPKTQSAAVGPYLRYSKTLPDAYADTPRDNTHRPILIERKWGGKEKGSWLNAIDLAARNSPDRIGILVDQFYEFDLQKPFTKGINYETANIHGALARYADLVNERSELVPLDMPATRGVAMVIARILYTNTYNPEGFYRLLHPTGFLKMNDYDQTMIACIDQLWNYGRVASIDKNNVRRYHTPWQHSEQEYYRYAPYHNAYVFAFHNGDAIRQVAYRLGLAAEDLGFSEPAIDPRGIAEMRTDRLRRSQYAAVARTLFLIDAKLRGDPSCSDVEITKEACDMVDGYEAYLRSLHVTPMPAEASLIHAFKARGGLTAMLTQAGYPVTSGLRNVVGPYNTGYSFEKNLTLTDSSQMTEKLLPFVSRLLESRSFDQTTGNGRS